MDALSSIESSSGVRSMPNPAAARSSRRALELVPCGTTRSKISAGEPTGVLLAFAVALGMIVVLGFWAMAGMRRAETAG